GFQRWIRNLHLAHECLPGKITILQLYRRIIPSPAERFLPGFLEFGEFGPEEPFAVGGGHAEPRFRDSAADARERPALEASRQSRRILRLRFENKARRRFAEEPDFV